MTDEKASNKIFASGKALFYGQTLMNASSLRNDMNDTYGLIPQPKYDEFQETYLTNCRDSVSAIMVPNTSKNTQTDSEMIGVVTEALCMYSYQDVVPAYYEVTMQRQYFNSQRYVDILNMVREGLTFDYAFAWFYGDLKSATGGGNPYDQIGRGCFGINGKSEKDPAAQYATYKDKWANYLDYCYGQMEVYGIIGE